MIELLISTDQLSPNTHKMLYGLAIGGFNDVQKLLSEMGLQDHIYNHNPSKQSHVPW